MAGLRGSTGWIMAARQPVFGTLATLAAATSFKSPFSGGNIGPAREFDQLAETDSSRDRGVSYIVTSGVEGTPEFYGRDANIGLWLLAALGLDTVTGSTNFVHTITPGSTIPYISLWRNISDTLFESYVDCKVSTLTISATAGQPLTVSAAVQGRQATRLAADPSGPPPTLPNIPLQAGYAYNYNDATVTLAGGATALVGSFECTIENNVVRQQTDAVIPLDVVEGAREVSLSFDLIFSNLDEYNKFHYGGVSGTAISSTLYTTSADFQFDNGANNQIKFTFPSIAYEDFPVEPSAAGDPITVSVRAVAQRNASGVITAVVKNQVPLY